MVQIDALECDGMPSVEVHIRWKGRLLQSRYNDVGQRICIGCNRWIDPLMFNKDPKAKDGLTGVCRDCRRFYLVRWRLWRRYKLTPEDVEQLLFEQESRCAICRTEIALETLHIDHNSGCCPGKTSASGCGHCVRGLLCPKCNQGMGCFQHNPEIMRATIDYLERHHSS